MQRKVAPEELAASIDALGVAAQERLNMTSFRSRVPDIGAFVEKVESGEIARQGHTAYFEHTTKDGVMVSVESDAVIHTQGISTNARYNHPLSREDWGVLLNNLDNIDSYVNVHDPQRKRGKSVGIKIITPEKSYGAIAEFAPNGLVWIVNALADSSANVDHFLGVKKEKDAAVPMHVGSPSQAKTSLDSPGGNVGHSFSIKSIRDELEKSNSLEKYKRRGKGGEVLNQESPHEALASYVPTEMGKGIIELYKNANMASLPHEMMHHFIALYRNAEEAGALDEASAADFKALRDFVGSEGGDFTREQNEKIVSAFETYLSEGRAPSLELVGTFQKFKKLDEEDLPKGHTPARCFR